MSDTNHRHQTPPPNCCSRGTAELKVYQSFIFSVPIFFTFVLLLLFYLIYLRRRRRLDWSSVQMRTSNLVNNEIVSSELGLKKEVREMLPIIVYKESFTVTDTQCSVCLGEYEAGEKLQQIPACGHIFHMDCIGSWLSTHTTCPLCRLSLLPPPDSTTQPPSEPHHRQTTNTPLSSSSSSSIHSCENPPTPSNISDSQRMSVTDNDAAQIV